MASSVLVLHCGGEVFDKFGTFTRRLSSQEDLVKETLTRTGGAYETDHAGGMRIAAANAMTTAWRGEGLVTPVAKIEAARTNGWTFPEDFSHGDWSATIFQASISADAAVAPDGNTTADKLVEDTTSSSNHYQRRLSPTVTAGTQQAWSFYVKSAERTHVVVQTDFTTIYYQSINIDTGVLGTSDGSGTLVVTTDPLGSGWRRVNVSMPSESATSGWCYIIIAANNQAGGGIFTGDGASGIYIWGAEFEVDKPWVGSYKAGGLTRGADTVSVPFHVPPQALTMYARFQERGTAFTTNGAVAFIGTSSPSTDPRLSLEGDGDGTYSLVYDNGTATATASIATAVVNGESIELRGELSSDGALTIGQSRDAAAETTATATAPSGGLAATWAGATVYPGSRGGSDQGVLELESLKIARGSQSMATMRALGV